VVIYVLKEVYMKHTRLVIAALIFSLSIGIAYAGPPMPPMPPMPPFPLPPPPPGPVVVVPPIPLPPGIVIRSGEPEYWFWDDDQGLWFYYDRHNRRHFARRHVYVDDGRHYYAEEGRWTVHHGDWDRGRHKGWHKKKHEIREERREERHEDRGRHEGWRRD
jgi:hypothetical protein